LKIAVLALERLDADQPQFPVKQSRDCFDEVSEHRAIPDDKAEVAIATALRA
jgi:hypothetical protein